MPENVSMLFSKAYLQQLLNEAMDEVDAPAGCGAAVEGSIAEGFGNESSDIDFLLIHDSHREFPRMPTLLFIRHHRVEVRICSTATVRHHAEEVFRCASLGRRGLARLAEEVLDRCQRLSSCVPLQRPDVIDGLRCVLPADALARVISKWFAEQARGSARCASAMAALGQELVAVSWAKSALTQGAKSWLAGRGETYLAKKWMSQQFDRICGGAAVRDRVFSLDSPERAGLAPDPYVKEVVRCLSTLGIQGCDADPQKISLRRKRAVTTWQIGPRVHVVHQRRDIFALSAQAAAVWRTMTFRAPLPRALEGIAAPPDVAGRLIAEFHGLGLIDFQWRGGWLLRARTTSVPPPNTLQPILSMEGAAGLKEDDNIGIGLVPIPAPRFAAAGMQLAYVNMVLENAREDATGALRSRQWRVFERAAQRMLRHACMAVLSAHGVNPLPSVEEVHHRLSDLEAIPSDLKGRIAALADGLMVDDEHAAAAALASLDRMTLEIRDVTGTSLFPSCFASAEEWQRTLDIGYDWVRLGAYLDAAFPVDQARDLVSTAGQQPHLKAGGDSGSFTIDASYLRGSNTALQADP